MHPPPLIAFNHLFIDSRPLSGPGHYAVQLLEHMLRLPEVIDGKVRLRVYAQEGTEYHYSDEAKALLVTCPSFRSKSFRVMYEQAILPFRTKMAKVGLLFSPAFVSPMWGACRKVVAILDMYYRVIPELIEKHHIRYWRLFIPLSASICDRVITISKASQNDIERFLPDARGRTIAIPLASRFDVKSGADGRHEAGDPFVLMVANLSGNKNCEVVVEAVSKSRASGRNIRFLHVGKDYLGFLQRSVEAHGAADYVKTLGKVSDSELESLYKECLCVVVPSHYEGFGMPAIEAQAMAAPLICSTAPALVEAAGDGALFIEARDSEALARHFARLMDEPSLRNELAAAGRKNVAGYSWQATARRTLDVFKELLER